MHVDLSVVVPVLDEADELPRLLDELASQSLPLQIVIADGGSRDRSREIVERSERALWVQAPRGRGAQMNAGAAAAIAENLLFLHVDSHLMHRCQLEQALQSLEAARRRHGGCIAGHFALAFRRQQAGGDSAYRYMEAKSRSGRPGTINGDQGLLLSADFFRELGGFDTRLPFFEDQKMAAEIFRRGRWLLLPGVLGTSARRFETEGLAPRYALMALMTWMHQIGLEDFLQQAVGVYREQSTTHALDLRPFVRLARRQLLQALSRQPGLVERIGRSLRANAWQPWLALDLLTGRPVDSGTLRWFTDHAEPRLHGAGGRRLSRALARLLLLGLRLPLERVLPAGRSVQSR